MNGTNFASICQPVVSVLKKPRFCFKDPGLAKTYSTRTRRKFDTCLSEDCGLNDKKARRFSNLRALEGLKTQRFRPQYLFHLPVWCARLDSNQRPTESEWSYQAVKEKTQVSCGFQVRCTKLAPICKNRGSPWRTWAPTVFLVFGK